MQTLLSRGLGRLGEVEGRYEVAVRPSCRPAPAHFAQSFRRRIEKRSPDGGSYSGK